MTNTTRWKVVTNTEDSHWIIEDEDGFVVGNFKVAGPTEGGHPKAKEYQYAHQIVREHNVAVDEAEHPERVIDKYFEDYSKLKRAHEVLVEALEPLATLDIKHLSEKPDKHPIIGINDTMILVGHVRKAQAALRLAQKGE